MNAEEEYLELIRKILTIGKWVTNERTGKRCLTIINHNLEYDVCNGHFPVISSRTTYWKQAIAEMNGYLRGYSSAKQFRAIGANTWDANANAPIWQENKWCAGPDDMGRVYGVQGRKWAKPHAGYVDQYAKIIANISSGYDDRGEILSFYNPGEFDMGCLRPCMHTHQFSLLGDTLHLNSYQRSVDVGLGLVFNMPQCYYLLAVTAQITGKKPGMVNHNLVNCHIYEDQIPAMLELLKRGTIPLNLEFTIDPKINSLHALETCDLSDAFKLTGYQSMGPLKVPFSV
jgi:thymidylate synthase